MGWICSTHEMRTAYKFATCCCSKISEKTLCPTPVWSY